MATQVECIEVAGGGEGGDSADGFGGWFCADGFAFGRTLAGRGLVMAGGGDEVAVTGVKIEVC